ncbi:MAG: response regulator transcription factor [Chloroflexi bacterium]|nr:response regulator transcription factor [Chloroflexota bacterium]
MIRVLLADDHAAFRQPLAFMLNREPDMVVVGQAGTIAEAREQLAGADLAVTDLDLPDGHGEELIRAFRLANPRGQVLVVTAWDAAGHHAVAVDAGAAAVLHKSVGIPEIIACIRQLAAGERVMEPSRLQELKQLAARERENWRGARRAPAGMTTQDRDVLRTPQEGKSDGEFGPRSNTAPHRVRAHMASIHGKLVVKSRLQALVFAVRSGAPSVD